MPKLENIGLPDELTPDFRKLWRDTKRKLLDQSPLKSGAGAEVHAETVACCLVKLRMLTDEAIEGDINAEEQRTIPSLASNIKRHLDALGLSGDVFDEDEEADL